MKLFSLLAKDAKLLLRNRAVLVALLVYPILLASVLGVAFQEPPSKLDLVVYNGDAGGAAVDIAGDRVSSASFIEAARSFANVKLVASEQAAISSVRRGEADAALLIPLGFVGDLTRLGSQARLQVIVDESDPVRASVARNTVEGGVDAFLKSIVTRKIADVETLINLTVSGGTTRVSGFDVNVLGIEQSRAKLTDALSRMDPGSPQAAQVREVISFLDFTLGTLGNADAYLVSTAIPVDVETSGLSSARASLVSVALPGAMVLGVFWTGSLTAALLVSRERETGALRRVLAAHPTPGLTGLSKALIALLVALVPALLLMGVGVFALGAEVKDPLFALDVLILGSLAAAALGAIAAAIARDTSASTLLAVLALVPMLLLGGLFYPVAYMPAPAQAVARALPVTATTDALRGAMLRGSSVQELAFPLIALVAFIVLAASATAWLSRRKKR